MELIWITEATYVDRFNIQLKFNNGVQGTVDLENHLNGPILQPLKDINYFKNFRLNSWTIEWDNGADISPEFLYQLTKKSQLQKA